MQIVGVDISDREETHVHTIDTWFSARRKVWIVERLNADGHLVGHAHYCVSEQDAAACLADWLRAHGETVLVSPKALTAIRNRALAAKSRRQAA